MEKIEDDRAINRPLFQLNGLNPPFMKTILAFIFSSLSLFGHSQCYTFYGAPAPCPTVNDSLEIYQNAVKVYEFYHRNKTYKPVKTVRIKSAEDQRMVYEKMLESRKMYFVLRNNKNNKKVSGKTQFEHSVGYKDVGYNQYFNQVSAHRFRQRDLENQIINAESPFPLYDNRIAPIVINEYKCLDSSSKYFGDIVNIPMYIPVVVKPQGMLSKAELAERNSLLGIVVQETPEEKETVNNGVATSADLTTAELNKGVPIYYYNGYGSGSLIGFLHKRTFHRICKSDYHNYAIPKFARELLDDEEALTNWIKTQFGSRYQLTK
jgi:hypothetical protein